MSASSSSAWLWDSTYLLYYNPKTQIYASPQPDGSWKYSDPPSSSTASTSRQPTSYSDIDEGTTLPEEQVWPDEEEPALQDLHAKTPLLRLVLAGPSSLISPPQAIALIDPAEPVSLGRDKSYTPRIRLKELPVSKSHATVCWIEEAVRDGRSEGYWGVVDNGSTHGTFLGSPELGKGKEKRLSESKVASSPHELKHLDTLRVGSTIFNAHIHPSLACSACSVATDSSNLIPLLPTEPVSAPKEAAPDAYVTKTKAQKEQERRDKMRGLKEQFLKPASAKAGPFDSTATTNNAASSSTKPGFIDRAAARRSRTGAAAKPPPTSSSSAAASSSPFFAVPGSRNAPDYSSTPSAPPSDPFGATSKGAVLLSKLGGGGSASSSISTPQGGLGTLIQPKSLAGGSREERPGLGSRPLSVVGGGGEASALGAGEKRGWREDVREANRKRFREM
ncbi:hypothetical protein BCR35DRAFT_300734 [Leucosporidium creatinivorum]|uniref:FHA domain-containing protein n=1 Tax=Leucosporidium creatinivorum TaxID=106004 RepID=A0A1Y2FY23_9BASI|nr:hypothetical protein BCR35DRAFT_300734 [Leucosporidium creatinivorum]